MLFAFVQVRWRRSCVRVAARSVRLRNNEVLHVIQTDSASDLAISHLDFHRRKIWRCDESVQLKIWEINSKSDE